MIAAIVEARMGSTRLPGKVLKKAVGKSLLYLLVERLKHSKFLDDIVIATTINPQDNKIVKFCEKHKIKYFRGSEHDVLDRFYKTAKYLKIDPIVHITADCPLIDPKITDKVIKFYLDNKEKYDFVSNQHPFTYPDGLDTAVYPFSILEIAWKNAKKPEEREHVTPYIWRQPKKFRMGNIQHDKNLFNRYRLTLDYEEDYKLIKKIFEELYTPKKIFHLEDIIKLLNKKPELVEINKKHIGKTWYT